MQQVLHLLIVDVEGRMGVCELAHARRMLPVLSCSERVRPGPLVRRWLAEHNLTGMVVGQWLGRAIENGHAIDWLMVVRLSTARATAALGLSWAPLESLHGSSLLEYQEWALSRATVHGSLPSVSGPFGTTVWFDAVEKWVGEVVGLPTTEDVTSYRTTPYEVVLGLATRRGRLYFKGLSPERTAEMKTTVELSHAEPALFARTLATDTRPDGSVWWLTAQCGGAPLAEDLTRASIVRVSAACADVQRRVRLLADVVRALPELKVSEAIEWAKALIEMHDAAGKGGRQGALIECAHREISTCELPQSWIPLDLDPANVLLDGKVVRFIDLDGSYLGLAPLAIATFVRRLKRWCADGIDARTCNACYAAYEHAWHPPLRVGQQWRAFETMSAILEAHEGWIRVAEETARGEITGVVDLAAARLARRLTNVLREDDRSDYLMS